MTSVRKFRAVPESVPAARRFVRDTLRDQARELIQAAELMTSELATNCIQHANTDFELAIETHGEIRVEVRDTDQGEPKVQFPTPEDQSGRGLRIVEAMSDTWGVIPSSRGKTVWFALYAHASGADGSERSSAARERRTTRAEHAGGERAGVKTEARERRRSCKSPKGRRRSTMRVGHVLAAG